MEMRARAVLETPWLALNLAPPFGHAAIVFDKGEATVPTRRARGAYKALSKLIDRKAVKYDYCRAVIDRGFRRDEATLMSPEAAQSSETERIVKVLKRFRPRDSVLMLADGDGTAFLKTWSLARLLAWAVLEQRPGKRRLKPDRSREANPRQTIRTKTAKQVGHLTLAYLLDRWIEKNGVQRNDETVRLMLSLFMSSGGFGLFVQGRGARGLLSSAKGANRKLGYVYRIVLFLCRYKQHIGADAKFNIDTAKRFVELNAHEGNSTYGLSKISKIWEKYKQAAPYIFAFYRYFSRTLERTKLPNEVVDFLEGFSSDQLRLARILGRAAYATDILGQRARGVRLRDFKQIARMEPPFPPFQQEELAIIESIDPQAAIPIRRLSGS
jgi:hypothetical protein